jgi:hypothetical protein
MFKLALVAASLGVLVTFALIGVAFVADDAGYESLARVLMWPNAFLQSITPVNEIGTAAHQFSEGTPLNVAAFYVSIPLGFVVYGLIVYAFLRLARRDA